MKPDSAHRKRWWRRRRRGSALIIVLILLSIMAVLIVSNSVVLHRLRVELQLLEQKQNRAWASPAGPKSDSRTPN